MRERGVTFEQVAASAGVSVRTVYNAADGLNSNRGTRKLIALALGCPVEELWPTPAPLPDSTPAQVSA